MNVLKDFRTNNAPKNGQFYLIAIDGRGGSGKTSLLDYLKVLLPDFVALNGDDYFEPATDGVAWGYFNDKRFKKDVIAPLTHGRTFTYRPYDWHAEPHISKLEINVKHGLILERCYSFEFNINWDIKIWVETPKEVCFERGVKREHMPHDKAVRAWNVWQTEEDEYITKFQPVEHADIVLDGTKSFPEQLK